MKVKYSFNSLSAHPAPLIPLKMGEGPVLIDVQVYILIYNIINYAVKVNV